MFHAFRQNSNASAIFQVNPFLSPQYCRGHIILSHPTEQNSLILNRGENAYQRLEEGYLKAEDRTIAGGINLVGSNIKKYSADCNFVVNLDLANHFRRLLALQENPIPITVTDNWTAGRSAVYSAVISIGDGKWETPVPGQLFLLQFALKEP